MNHRLFLLSLGALIGLTCTWMVLGWLRPGYSSIRQAVSDLGVGNTAPMMNGAFVLCGLIFLAGVITIAKRLHIGPRWLVLALSPLGLVLVGLFPETIPLAHFTGATLLFQTPSIAFLLLGFELRRQYKLRRVGNWLLFASVFTLAVTILAMLTPPPESGLAERIMLVEIQAWYVLIFRFTPV